MLDKNKVFQVLKNNSLCVLSTADLSGKSESAIMMYTTKDDLNILISTKKETRKFGNILVNNQVSIVVGGLKDDPSLQIEGKIRILENDEKVQATKFMLSIHPELKDFGIEGEEILEITPNWVRLIDYSQEPNVEEINL
jgi:uncharacterized pyridoxamine 5'-phosphate oxidase family protein